MAQSMWREKLNSNSMFTALSENLSKLKQEKDSKNILECIDDSIFVWDDYNQCVLSTNVDIAAKSSDSPTFNHQVLMCSNPPISRVTQLLLNERGNLLALIGPQGITVLEVPIRWGKYGKFEGGKPKIICKSYAIAERFFVCSPEFKVLQARWFPETDSYITVLTSDNYLRIYKVDEPESPIHSFNLTENNEVNSSSVLSTTFNITLSLRENAISFDFGPPIDTTFKEVPSEGETIKKWPLFILKGNGDVYSLLLNAPASKSFQSHVLQGPFLMHPAADDNYGVDSCSVLCLKCTPPVLVVATSSGAIYHCIVLESNAEADDPDDSRVSIKTSENKINWSLYVIENIELELSLTTASEYCEDIMCPINLHHDPTTYMRYHCSHSAGIHTMALPFIHHLEQFVEKENIEDIASLPSCLEKECIVEHLLCTKPLPTSPDSPVLGISIMDSHQLGLTLLCLTSQLKPICLPLTNIFFKQPSSVLLEDTSANVKKSQPNVPMFKESFKDHIVKILRRSSSNPMIKSNPLSEPSSEERLQLLTRATQVFREEYITRLDSAREEIERRVRVLHQQKKQQVADMQTNISEQVTIKAKMEKLKSSYDIACSKQKELTKRTRDLLMCVKRNTPITSDAERSLMKEYEDMNKKLKDYHNMLEKIKLTKNYQESLPKYDSASPLKSSLNDTQLEHLKEAIIKESEEISESKKIITSLKKELSI